MYFGWFDNSQKMFQEMHKPEIVQKHAHKPDKWSLVEEITVVSDRAKLVMPGDDNEDIRFIMYELASKLEYLLDAVTGSAAVDNF